MANQNPDNVFYISKAYESNVQMTYSDEQAGFGEGSSGGGGMWQQSVETRLSELGADMRTIRTEMNTEFREARTRQERDFRFLFGALISVAVGLAGLMAKGFGWIG